MKLLYLYSKNVISYLEFINVASPFLMSLDKNLCLLIKESIEGRTLTRKNRNPFNLKIQIDHYKDNTSKPLNISYKRINGGELIKKSKIHELINK